MPKKPFVAPEVDADGREVLSLDEYVREYGVSRITVCFGGSLSAAGGRYEYEEPDNSFAIEEGLIEIVQAKEQLE